MIEIGSILEDRYEILDSIGQGSFCAVYKAMDKKHSEVVALKLLDRKFQRKSLENIIRFRREAQTLSRLRHKNLVKFLGFGENSENSYILLEFLEGTSLDKQINIGGELQKDILLVLHILSCVAEGLEYTHRQGILHRDIKPTNIMLVNSNGNGQPQGKTGLPAVKIFDFGLSRLIDYFRCEYNSGIAGTLFYMAPECAGIFQKPIDQRADLYSLGILGYELLAGERPYGGPEAGILLQQHLTRVPPPLSHINPCVPTALSQIIARLMAKAPEERYPSAGSLLIDLRALGDSLSRGEKGFQLPASPAAEVVEPKAQVPFVERSREMAAMKKLLTETHQGRGRLTFISGDAGIGKTRLAEEFRTHVLAGEGTFLYGKCDQYRSQVPYQPFNDILDDLAIQAGRWPYQNFKEWRERTITSLAKHPGLLHQLVPDLKSGKEMNSGQSEVTPVRESEGYQYGLCRVFELLPESRSPVVLVLDDLQWAQEETYEVLMMLRERIDDLPVLIIGLYREKEFHKNSKSLNYLQLIRNRFPETDISSLKALSPEGVRFLTREFIGCADQGFRPLYSNIYRISRGNPFFVHEILQTLFESGAFKSPLPGGSCQYDPEKYHENMLPDSLLSIILNRLEQPSQPARATLSIAAVLGRQFDFERLLAVSSLKEYELMDHLDELARFQFIEETQIGTQTSFRFPYDKIRHTVYEQIPLVERQAIHEKAGQVLEKGIDSALSNTIFDLAHHFSHGLDAAKAMRYLIAAGDQAYSQAAYRETAAFYAEAWKRHDDRSSETFLYLTDQLLELYPFLGEYDDALAVYKAGGTLPESRLDRARMERKISSVFVMKGEFFKAVGHLETALALLGKRHFKKRWAIFLSILFQLCLRLLPKWPFSFQKRLQRATRKQPLFAELCRIYRNLSLVCLLDDTAGLIEASLLKLRYAGKSGDIVLVVESYMFEAIALATTGRFNKARKYSKKILSFQELQVDSDHPYFKLSAAYIITMSGAMIDFFQGRLKEAEEKFEQAIPEIEKVEAQWELNSLYMNFALLLVLKGRFSTALEYFQKIEARLARGGSYFEQLSALIGMSVTYAEQGNLDKAHIYLEKTKGSCSRIPYPFFKALFHQAEAIYNVARGEFAQAFESMEQAILNIKKRPLYSYHTVQSLLFRILFLQESLISTASPVEKKAGLKRVARLLWASRPLVNAFPLLAANWRLCRGIYLAQTGKVPKALRIFKSGARQLEAAGALQLLGHTYAPFSKLLAVSGYKEDAEYYQNCYGRIQELLFSEKYHGEPEEALTTPAPALGSESPHESSVPEPLAGAPAFPLGFNKLDTLMEVNRLVTASLELKQVLERIIDLSMTTLGAERGFLMLYRKGSSFLSSRGADDAGSSLKVFLARNMDQTALEQEAFAFSRSVVQMVEKTGEAVVITDAQKDSRFQDAESVILQDLRSILCVPLIDQEQLIGLVYLDNHLVAHLFTTEDLALLKSLASSAVIAINNALAYEKICRQRDRIQHQHDEIQILKQKLQDEVDYLSEEISAEHNFEEMVGGSPAMQRVFSFIDKAAPLQQSVLIQGETGTGKELVARAIHRRSPRGDKPMIKVNCAAIPEGLLESEMFGYEKGAFTGAVKTKAGRFELADGGTLFLDEIGEMSPALQAKLLQVLESWEFERIGGLCTQKVNIRLITATNRDLKTEIKEGRFREDLYHRLNVLPLSLPPLRERGDDVLLLLTYFIERLSKKFNKHVKTIDKSGIEAARGYHWPGNVRELEHLVERAMSLSDSACLKLEPMLLSSNGPATEGLDRSAEGLDFVPGGFQESLDNYKRKLVQEAMRRTGGTKKEAARLLGLSPSNFSHLLNKLEKNKD